VDIFLPLFIWQHKCLRYKGFVAETLLAQELLPVTTTILFVDMLRILLLILVLAAAAPVSAQKAEVVKFDRLQELLDTKSDKILVINFWATWCAPCVHELPYFQRLEDRKDPSVQITLVNLDYADKLEKVNAFLEKKKITSKVLLLDEIDYNAWIDRVDPSWGGAIPATLFIDTSTGRRKFVDKELTESELDLNIKSFKSSN
jgi:thiol-disulfide isomerase/thioredoxin